MANHSLASSSTIPPVLAFSDFKFETIGKEPQLLKRISAPTPDFHYNDNDHSSPSPHIVSESERPSLAVSPRPQTRPSLLQSLSDDHTLDIINKMLPETQLSESQSSDPRNTYPVEQPLPARPPDYSGLSALSAPFTTSGDTSSPRMPPSQNEKNMMLDQTKIARSPTIPVEAPAQFVPSVHEAKLSNSSIHFLRALQTRLLSSLSNLDPPNMTDTLILVQAANTHAANALTTAHRSHLLAQQSLATAREAVTAAQESLSAAEQSKARADDALAAIEQFYPTQMGHALQGNSDWQWKINLTKLQDDLRVLGQWIGEKEGEEAAERREVDRLEARRKDKGGVEVAMSGVENSGLAPHIVQAMNLEVAQRAAAQQSRRSSETPQAGPSSNRDLYRQRLAELEADAAMKAWSSQQRTPSKDLSTASLPTSGYFAKAGGLDPSPQVDDLVQRALHDKKELLQAQQQQIELTALQAQYEEETPIRESSEKKPEVAGLEKMQQRSEISEDAPGVSLPLRINQPPVNNGANRSTKTRSKSRSTIVDDAKHALQAHKEKELALAEQRRLLEERKERELAELKKREEEKVAEQERLDGAREEELIAKQAIRRQEVMAQKQRATAEMAAKINAERARERGRSQAASHSPILPTPQPHLSDHLLDLSYGAKTIEPAEKTRLLSSGPDSQPIPLASLPPSPSAHSTALGLRSSRFNHTHAVSASPERSSKMSDVRMMSPLKSSQQSFRILPRTPSPTDDAFDVYSHSQDSGNICVVPRLQLPPTSPEAQAANLRFVRDGNGNGAHRESFPLPNIKSDPSLTNETLDITLPLKKESLTTGLLGSQKWPPLTTPAETVDVKPILNSLPRKPPSLTPVDVDPAMKRLATTGSNYGRTTTSQVYRETTTVSPPDTSCAPSFFSLVTDVPNRHVTIAEPEYLNRPSIDNTFSNPYHDNLILPPWIKQKPPHIMEATSLANGLTSILREPPVRLNLFDDASQIAPTIQASGWDHPVDDEGHDSGPRVEEPTPPQRPRHFRQGADHYPPPPRTITPNPYAGSSYLRRSTSPMARSSTPSPVLGKRRFHHDFRDEPPSRRQRGTNGTRGARSPMPRKSSRRRPSPERTALQARMQIDNHPNTSHVRPPPSRELAWRSPSPERPALQARIGVRDIAHSTGGGQSYRPTYSSTEPFKRPQSRGRNIYQPGQPEYPTPYSQERSSYRHQITDNEPRGPSHRGRGNLVNRGVARGRGRGGNRNLEQRISSNQPPTLMNRLESPPDPLDGIPRKT